MTTTNEKLREEWKAKEHVNNFCWLYEDEQGSLVMVYTSYIQWLESEVIRLREEVERLKKHELERSKMISGFGQNLNSRKDEK